MATLALELNDARLVLARDAEAPVVVADSEGYALLEGESVLTGDLARSRARLRPIYAYNRYWREIGTAPLPRANVRAQTAADLAFAHLDELLAPHRAPGDELLIALPAGYQREQLGLLLGVAGECGVQVTGLIDAAVAAVANEVAGERLLHLDLELHHAVLTVLEPGPPLRRAQSELLPRHGLLSLQEKWVEAIAAAFVRRTRFDPLHEARNEQVLWNSLGEWLVGLDNVDAIEIELTDGTERRSVELLRENLLATTRDRYEAVCRFVQTQCPAGVQTVLVVTDRVASAPGLVAVLSALPAVSVHALPHGAAALGALRHAAQIRRPAGQVSLITRLEGMRTRQVLDAPAPAAPSAAVPDRERPTHIVHAGRALPISSTSLTIGSGTSPSESRALQIPAGPGISREHCRVVRRDGHAWLEDRSTYGTFVNESPVKGSVALRVGDRVRLGSPGVTLELIQVVDDHGAPTTQL
jgi:hypothetical protein